MSAITIKHDITKFSPVDYIWNQNDSWFIDRLSSGKLCCVRSWSLGTRRLILYRLKEAFDQKQFQPGFAEWGHDVAHDWEWWRKQMPYFLEISIYKRSYLWITLLFLPTIHKTSNRFTIEPINKRHHGLEDRSKNYEQLDDLYAIADRVFPCWQSWKYRWSQTSVAFLFYKHGPIDRIESHNDTGLSLM